MTSITSLVDTHLKGLISHLARELNVDEDDVVKAANSYSTGSVPNGGNSRTAGGQTQKKNNKCGFTVRSRDGSVDSCNKGASHELDGIWLCSAHYKSASAKAEKAKTSQTNGVKKDKPKASTDKEPKTATPAKASSDDKKKATSKESKTATDKEPKASPKIANGGDKKKQTTVEKMITKKVERGAKEEVTLQQVGNLFIEPTLRIIFDKSTRKGTGFYLSDDKKTQIPLDDTRVRWMETMGYSFAPPPATPSGAGDSKQRPKTIASTPNRPTSTSKKPPPPPPEDDSDSSVDVSVNSEKSDVASNSTSDNGANDVSDDSQDGSISDSTGGSDVSDSDDD